MGKVKLNWDASLDRGSKKMGVGVIARDERGLVVAFMCTTIPFITDPSIAEAVAAWKGGRILLRSRLPKHYFGG